MAVVEVPEGAVGIVEDVQTEDFRPFSDLLPYGPAYGDPEDGIVFLQEPGRPQDGGLGAVWAVEPRNVGVMAQAGVEQMAQSLEILFRAFEPGTVLQVILHMAPTDRVEKWSAYRKGGSDDERFALNEFQEASLREGLAHAEGGRRWRLHDFTTLVTVRMGVKLPKFGNQERLLSFLKPDKTMARYLDKRICDVVDGRLEDFNNLCNITETVFTASDMLCRRLDCRGIHREILRCLHPWQRKVRCFNPALPMREQLLTVPAVTTDESGWEFGPDYTVEDDKTPRHWQVRVMSLQQAPARTFPGILSSLHAPKDFDPLGVWEVSPDYPMTVVTQVGVPDQSDERQRLRQKRQFAIMQSKNMLGTEDLEKVKVRESLDEMVRDTGSYILHSRVHLVLWERKGVSMASKFSMMTQAGRVMGLELLPETILGNRLFLQTLPLGLNLEYPKDQMLRRSRRISSIATAHMLPIYGDFTGTRTAAQLYINRRGEAVTFDFFDSETAPHAIVAGKSRSGKSFFVNHMLQQVLPLGASIVILDRWASYDTLCEVYGGEYFEIDLNQPICFNPFMGPLDAGHRTFLMALIDQMASGVSGQDAGGLGQVDKAICSRLLALYSEWHETHGKNPDGSRREPLLREFYDILNDTDIVDTAFAQKEAAKKIALRISQYVGRGEYAGFVDGQNQLNLTNVLTIFELAKLGDAPDLQSVLLLTLMYRLMQYVTNPNSRMVRKYLILDEVWALLKHATAAAFLEEAARALARFRCCAIFMSQQLSDFTSDAAKAIKGNSGSYLFLQQNAEEVDTIARLFELSDQEKRILREVRKRPTFGEGYMWQPENKGGVIRVVADPFLRWLASQKPPEKVAREAICRRTENLNLTVKYLAKKYPNGFQYEVPESEYMADVDELVAEAGRLRAEADAKRQAAEAEAERQTEELMSASVELDGKAILEAGGEAAADSVEANDMDGGRDSESSLARRSVEQVVMSTLGTTEGKETGSAANASGEGLPDNEP